MNARILLNPAAGRGRGARLREAVEALARLRGVELVRLLERRRSDRGRAAERR